MRISCLALLAAVSVTACSGTAVGTGGGTSGTSGSGTVTGDPPTGSSDGTASVPPSGTAKPPPSGPSAYDPLFDAPASPVATAGVLSGLWAGSTYDADVRLKLGTSSIVIAVRCGSSAAIGLEVSAVITASSIRVLASKSIGPAASCGIKVTPQEIPRCAAAPRIGCFDVKGTTLSFEGIWLFSSGGSGPDSNFSKLSD